MQPAPQRNRNNTDAQELAAGVQRLLQELEPPLELAERVQHNPSSCPICYTDFSEDSDRTRVYSLAVCGHTFCHSCLEGFIDNRITRCPLCNMTHGLTRNGNNLVGTARNYLAEAIIDQPRQMSKQKHFCWDCEVVFQVFEPAELYDQHTNHDTTFLGDIEDDAFKKFFWMLKRLKERSYNSARTQGMIQAFLVFLRNMMLSLSQVEDILEKDPKAFEKLKQSMRKLVIPSDNFNLDPVNDKFMQCLAHLWSFEVEWAQYNMKFIQTTRTPQGAAVTEKLLAKLREDWQSVLPIGLPEIELPKFPGLSPSARKLFRPKIEPEEPTTEESRRRSHLANKLRTIADKLADPKITVSKSQMRRAEDMLGLINHTLFEPEPRMDQDDDDYEISWLSQSSANPSAADEGFASLLGKRFDFLGLDHLLGNRAPPAKSKEKKGKAASSKKEPDSSEATLASSSRRKRSKN